MNKFDLDTVSWTKLAGFFLWQRRFIKSVLPRNGMIWNKTVSYSLRHNFWFSIFSNLVVGSAAQMFKDDCIRQNGISVRLATAMTMVSKTEAIPTISWILVVSVSADLAAQRKFYSLICDDAAAISCTRFPFCAPIQEPRLSPSWALVHFMQSFKIIPGPS